MTLLLLGLFVVTPFIFTGYALPKLLVLSLGGLLLGRRRRTSLDFGLSLLWWVLLAGTIFSVDPVVSVTGRYNDWSHGLIAWACFTMFALHGAQVTAQERSRSMTLLSWAGVGMSLVCIVQSRWMPRTTGAIGDPVAVGALLALLTPICADKHPLLLAPVLLGLWATGSRGAMLGAALGVMLIFRRKTC